MKKNSFILFFVFLVINVSAQTKQSKSSTTKKPNIIFILADDLGTGEVGCYGSDNNKTPNIDKLAKTGLKFNHAYTAPLCGPSRALILTGRYAFRTGAVNQDMVGKLKPSEETLIPTVLKTEGYKSAMIGKWSQFGLTPADFGFDDYITFKGSGVYWAKEKKKAEEYYVNGETKALGDEEYMPDLMHTQLVNFIKQNKNNPFYIHYAMVHVHSVLQPTPDSKPDTKDIYADNIAYMDKLVGKLIKTLAELKLRENTLIVFMGDNGTANEQYPKATIGGKQLSGKKGSMLECGSLVPMITNWPGVISPNKSTKDLIDASDILPTLADLAGAKLPENKILDGRSFVPQLKGQKGSPRDWIFMELGNQWYVRDQKFKLNRAGELFDMSKAPFEENLVANVSENKEASEAKTRLVAVLERLNPAGGIMDEADGSGRHGNKVEKNAKKAEKLKKKENNND
jgi:arylsulfatase A